MNTTAVSTTSTTVNTHAVEDLKLEAVVIPVSDVDRAKAFYTGLGWRPDADFAFDNGFRVVQFNPPGSPASVQFGTNITAAEPGSAQGLYLVVSDIQTARDELAAHGVEISKVFHPIEPGAQFVPGNGSGRIEGRADQGASYGSFATFADPDGNTWLLQEITERLAGRVDSARRRLLRSMTLSRRWSGRPGPTASTRPVTAASTTSSGRPGTRPTWSPSSPVPSCRNSPPKNHTKITRTTQERGEP